MSLCHYVNLWFHHIRNMLCSSDLVLPYHLKKIQGTGEDLVKVNKDDERYRITSV